MFSLYGILFAAGLLTILLPCILPLIPIVLGVSIAGRSKWRPLLTVAGMLVSFVGFTFLLLVVLRQFVEVADYLRIATYYVLLLFGLGFLTHRSSVLYGGSLLGSVFFLDKGIPSMAIAALCGVLAMHFGGQIAARIQQFGADVQGTARAEFGEGSPVATFIIGLTMGLVWVPCAGPALGFVFTLIREHPGVEAALLLSAYGLGTAVPLLLIGYGGQVAVHSVRFLSRFSGYLKQISGVLLILTALAFQYNGFIALQTWFVEHTSYGTLGTRIEEQLFPDEVFDTIRGDVPAPSRNVPPLSDMGLPQLPKIVRAPEFAGLGPWHNSEPLTLASLKGKVVLVDFWTYSCINCIRTLPYLREYWDKYQDKPFVILGVHTPEFVFEKSEKNVADAVKRHGLKYPIAQDNDYGTWRAFANRYWPAKYLIDAEGTIRYTHFGEGGYDETDKAIQSLLAEIGVEVTGEAVTSEPGIRRDLTPEIYLGSRSWNLFGNGGPIPTDALVSYEAPEEMELHHYYLTGDWQMVDEERQVLHLEEGEIRGRFLGGEINLVLGLEEGSAPVEVDVEVDGEAGSSFTVDHHDLYNLFTGDYGEHDIILRIRGKGLEGYAFTFGS